MKTKIILLVLCVVLLLSFASLSYGKPDPKYLRLLEHPWEELLSPPHSQDNTEVILKSSSVVIVIPIAGDCFIYTKSVNAYQSSKGEYINPQSLKK